MGFKSTHLHHFILFLLYTTLNTGTTTVFAAVNVTIDYQDTSITYSPPGAWSQSLPSKLDLGGAHMLTQNPNATASFNFTGKFFFLSKKIFFLLSFFFFSFTFFFSFSFCKPGSFLVVVFFIIFASSIQASRYTF